MPDLARAVTQGGGVMATRWRRFTCRACGYRWELFAELPVPETCPHCGRTDKLSEDAVVAPVGNDVSRQATMLPGVARA